MTSEHLSQELEGAITAGFSLPQVVSALREYQRQGITRNEVQLALESLRDQTTDEVVEDRILEIMDVVSGFCSRENTVWEEHETQASSRETEKISEKSKRQDTLDRPTWIEAQENTSMPSSSIVLKPSDTPWVPPPDVLRSNRDDIHQAILEAAELGGQDSQGTPFGKGWYLQRAKARAIDAFRKRRREKKYLEAEAERLERLRRSPLLSHIDDPARLAEVNELAMLVHEALAELTPEVRRAVLRMLFLEGLSYSEISERLSITKVTARGHAFQGLRILREKLKARGIINAFREACHE
jgi:RNA polymerase sigma factor (sigma-70 family)